MERNGTAATRRGFALMRRGEGVSIAAHGCGPPAVGGECRQEERDCKAPGDVKRMIAVKVPGSRGGSSI